MCKQILVECKQVECIHIESKPSLSALKKKNTQVVLQSIDGYMSTSLVMALHLDIDRAIFRHTRNTINNVDLMYCRYLI